MKQWAWLAMLSASSVLALIVLACDSASGVTSGINGSNAVSPAAQGERQVIQVSMGKSQFHPESMTIPVGTTILWTNNDDVPHTVTAGDNSWDSDMLKKGETYTRTFDTTGKFCYYCLLHPGHNGNPCENPGVSMPARAGMASLGGGRPMVGVMVVE